jgi:hypothetical protein
LHVCCGPELQLLKISQPTSGIGHDEKAKLTITADKGLFGDAEWTYASNNGSDE